MFKCLKKNIAIACAALMTAGILAGCAPKTPQEHKHTFESEWTYDGSYHWHKATCEHTDETDGRAPHSMKDGICTVCRYARTVNHARDLISTKVFCYR